MIAAELARVAVIGSGELAHAYRQALREVPGARRIAVGLPGKIDAIVICDTAIAVSDQVGEWLSHGVAVLCHSELLAHCEQTRKAIAASREFGTPLAIMNPLCFATAIKQATDLIGTNLLGECRAVQISLSGAAFSIDHAISAACLGIDLARRWLGAVTAIQAVSFHSPLHGTGGEAWHIFLQGQQQAIGEVLFRPGMPNAGESLLAFQGTQGELVVGAEGSRYRVGNSGPWLTFGHGFQRHAALRAELHNFLEGRRGLATLGFAPRDMLLVAELWGIVESSAHNYGWLKLATSPGGGLFAALAATRAS